MRLLLDEHLSPKGVAKPLRRLGHDVVAVAEEAELRMNSDEVLVDVATKEGRIIVTYNARDFVVILTRRTLGAEKHPGCILVSAETVQPNQYARLVAGVDELLRRFPQPELWLERIAWLK